MKVKKLFALLLVVCMVCATSSLAFADGENFDLTKDTATGGIENPTEWGIDLTTEHDIINGNNAYLDFKERFDAKNLGMSQVKSLQSLGFSYDAILVLSTNQLKELLPTYGIRIVRAAPSNFIKLTGCGSGGNSTVYFHPNTGYRAGTWSSNDGSTVHTKIDRLAKAVYGDSSYVTRYYHYWGHWTDDYKTHQGVDMYKYEGDAIKSAHSGEVVTVGDTGRVGIYDGSVTYFYAHMKERAVSIGTKVSVGTILGYQSSVGAGSTHLHFEVRSGKTTYMGTQDNSINTLNPYSYM